MGRTLRVLRLHLQVPRSITCRAERRGRPPGVPRKDHRESFHKSCHLQTHSVVGVARVLALRSRGRWEPTRHDGAYTGSADWPRLPQAVVTRGHDKLFDPPPNVIVVSNVEELQTAGSRKADSWAQVALSPRCHCECSQSEARRLSGQEAVWGAHAGPSLHLQALRVTHVLRDESVVS